MDILKLTCDMNHHGVQFLKGGQNQAALSSFQDALTSIKNVVNGEVVCPCAEEPTTSPPRTKAGFTVYESPSRLSLSYGDCYVYSRPLLIYPTPTQDTDAQLALHSAVILFNMALTCHQIGRHGKESSLRRAATLYKMSTQLLLCPSQGGGSCAVLALLALNNRAQILYELCDFDHSKGCLKEIAKLIQTTRLQKSLPEKDLEGLLLNVMLLKTPSAAQAA